MQAAHFTPLRGYQEYSVDEMQRRATDFAATMRRRRTVRQFSSRLVPRRVIEASLDAAASAPSGANMQPWHFVVVSDAVVKHKIRVAAEEEERAFYGGRAPKEWLDALAPLGTDEDKPYLETAPYLIVVFAQPYHQESGDHRFKHYYVPESVGIATGVLITALHLAGLVTLTHTPSPMGFLNALLDRPNDERPFVILVAGYPTPDASVPVIGKKPLVEIVSYV